MIKNKKTPLEMRRLLVNLKYQPRQNYLTPVPVEGYISNGVN
ncbi:MAG: hypothetical protein PHR36_00760 [Patescibacteria group bacterium]|nr:hypothetical protein [Patescibacteria group bacterium]